MAMIQPSDTFACMTESLYRHLAIISSKLESNIFVFNKYLINTISLRVFPIRIKSLSAIYACLVAVYCTYCILVHQLIHACFHGLGWKDSSSDTCSLYVSPKQDFNFFHVQKSNVVLSATNPMYFTVAGPRNEFLQHYFMLQIDGKISL